MSILRKGFLIILVLFVGWSLTAQSAAEGETYFNSKQYAKAKTVYEALLKRNPKDALSNYRYARCCYELKDYEKAIVHFEQAGTRYPLRDVYLAELYFTTYRFEESVTAYNNYIATLEADDKRIAEFEKKIKLSELGQKLLNRIEDIAIIDSLVVNKNEFLRFYKQNRELGSVNQERVRLNNRNIQDKITYTTERGDRMCYSDSLKGNMDILSSYKLLDEWSKPVSVSQNINTSANENYPFLLLDGVTLYFASDGENSLGGYDIFITKYSASAKDYLQPENVGMPFNSPYNDYMMVIDEIQKVGWFATDRHQIPGKVVIYKFVPNDPKIYFRSDDAEITRQVARLNKSRKAEKSKIVTNQAQVTINNVDPKSDGFQLIINDSVMYTQLDQFQSTTALNIFKECVVMLEKKREISTELEKLRNDYALTEDSGIKAELGMHIISKENQLFDMEKQVSNKYIEAANEEINFIQKN